MELKTVEKRRAGTAIEYTHRDYTKEGGLREVETKLGELEQGCASHIYSLAQFAMKQGGTLKVAADRFSEMCEYAESSYKKKHEVANLKDVLPVWAVYKSNILRGMRLNFDPLEYETEASFRLAVLESLRTSGSGAEPTRASPAKQSERLTFDDADDLLDSTRMGKNLRGLIAKLVVEAEYIRKGREEEAEEIIAEAVQKLGGLIDHRRIKDRPTREAISMH